MVFLVSKAIREELLLFHISIFASVLSAIIALWLSLSSLKITGYSYVFGEDPKCNVHLDDIIEQYKTFPKDKTIARITDSYVVAITENSRFNDDNVKGSVNHKGGCSFLF